MSDVERNPDGTFAPGVCGNPNGRPKGSVSLRTLLRKKLEEQPVDAASGKALDKTYAEGLIEATLRDALKGDASARRLVWEYIDGKAGADGDAGGEGVVTIVDDL